MEYPNNSILYEDAAVQINENEIVIKKYFSPIPWDKKIPFYSIRDVFLFTKSPYNDSSISSFNPFTSSTHHTNNQTNLYIELWLK